MGTVFRVVRISTCEKVIQEHIYTTIKTNDTFVTRVKFLAFRTKGYGDHFGITRLEYLFLN